MKKLISMLIVAVIIIGCLGLVMSFAATIVYADEGYPAPIDEGYPVGYPVDIGYPIFNPCDPNNTEYVFACNPQNYGYPVDSLYPEPEQKNRKSFREELQIEIETVKQIFENIPPKEESQIYQSFQQLKVITKYYFGKMIAWAR